MRLLTFWLFASLVFGSDWTRFRGPNGTGISPDRNLPVEISKDRNVVWKQQTPKGNSSPMVVDGRLFITGHDKDDRIVLCYGASDGKLLWRRAITKARDEKPNPVNGPTTPSASTDGHSVFIFFPDFGLLAYDLAGNERWRVPLGPFGGVQGMAVSPIYTEGNVVLLIDTPEQAYIAAFDAANGKQTWKAERPVGFLGSYSTPALYKPPAGPEQIVVAGAVELTGYQARTGERLWWARGVTSGPAAPPLVVGDSAYTIEPAGEAAPPFKDMLAAYDKNKDGKIELSEVSGDKVNEKIMYRLFKAIDKITGNGDGILTEEEWNGAFNPDSLGGGLVRTRINGKGDVSRSHVAWRYTKGMPYLTGPLLYEDVLYVINNGGILTAFNPETGELLRKDRLKDAIGDYYASPVAGDGKIYFINHDGKTAVIRAGTKWEMLSSGDLDEAVIATPAIAGSRIYVRTENTLYCFGAKSG